MFPTGSPPALEWDHGVKLCVQEVLSLPTSTCRNIRCSVYWLHASERIVNACWLMQIGTLPVHCRPLFLSWA